MGDPNTVGVFYSARAFNQNLSKLGVQHVSNMDALFLGATAFNQDMSGGPTGNNEIIPLIHIG